mgnify:CR=1 FL=1
MLKILTAIGRDKLAHLHRDLDSCLRWFDEGTVRLSEVAKAYVLEKASNSNVSWVRSVLNQICFNRWGGSTSLLGFR